MPINNCPFAKMNFKLAGIQVYKIMYKLGWYVRYMTKFCVQAQWANIRRFTNKLKYQQTDKFFLCISFLTTHTHTQIYI